MKTKQFEITEQHLKLIRKMNVKYNPYYEFGAPWIDPKRPYGNVFAFDDIGEILGIEPEDMDGDKPEFSEDQQDEMMRIHKGTATALQIILYTGSFQPGIYETWDYLFD